VRLVLEEKGLPWTSHHIDLTKNEHTTEEFQTLNPKGVVPVLVHNGKTIIESNDIITYVDNEFDGPRLQPDSLENNEFFASAIARSSDIQGALKLVSFEFLFKPVRRMSPIQLSEYAGNVKNNDLVEFMREFSSEQGFSDQRIRSQVRELVCSLDFLENRLHSATWLNGEAFGLADISWIVNIYRLDKIAFPVKKYPALSDWRNRVYERDSFKEAIIQYESTAMTCFFFLYTSYRRLRGTGITSYL